MTTKKSATESLEAYGFVRTDEGWTKNKELTGKPRTRYVSVEGGFHRFEMEAGEWRQYPLSIHAEWEGVGGLAFDDKAQDQNAKVKPDCFEWVYPPEWVVNEYSTALEAREAEAAAVAADKAERIKRETSGKG